MQFDDILQCLDAMETGDRRSQPRDSRFALVEAEWDGKSSGSFSTSDDPLPLHEALELLASKVLERSRHPLARVLTGDLEELQPLAEPPGGNPFVDDALRSFAGARPVVVIVDGLTWGMEFTCALVELAPTGEPGGTDLALLDASARGDVDGIAAALAAGADVNTRDTEGMTPLHHAVAHRGLAGVETLLKAGADPLAQAGFGNSVCFAGSDEQGRVRARTERIENDEHWWILGALVEAGADVNARDPLGRTLIDLAIATVPYQDLVVEYLRDRGGRHARRAGWVFPDHLRRLSPGDWDEQAVRVNEVRYLLENDDDVIVTDALHWLLENGWDDDEVSAETLFELTDLLLDGGAQDSVVEERTPLDRAYDLFGNGERPQYRVVMYRLRKSGFTRSLRGMLEWLPDGDVDVQRAYVEEVRQRLETEGSQPESLHWLLSPHAWYEHEVGGEVLGELVDVLLAHGGENVVVEGRTPLGWARFWLNDRDEHPQYRFVVDRLLAAGFTYSVRDFLDRIPLRDTEAQRMFIGELRERLEMEGPQPDALHWLLSPHSKWSEEEVSGDVLGELTELLLEFGARDGQLGDTRPLERALNRVRQDGLGHYRSVTSRLEAAGFKEEALAVVLPPGRTGLHE